MKKINGTKNETFSPDPNLRIYLKIVFKEICDVGSNFQGISDSFFLVWSRIDPEQGLVNLGSLLFIFKITDDEAGKVGYHWH